jgi:HNH endonuclease/AP2 domain
MALTAERLRELLHYDPDTGDWTWLVHRGTAVAGSKAGSPIGSANKWGEGYLLITIDEKKYRAHRLAFLYMTGAIPHNEIDHRDCNKPNNRWDNLRVSPDRSRQMANKKMVSNNTSGVKGVCWDKANKKWVVHCQKDRKRYHLGRFVDIAAATAAYNKFALAAWGEFARIA